MVPPNAQRQHELRQYIHQDRHWPSESRGIVEITGMDPIHAFNALRQLRSQLLHDWPEVQRTPLAMALLEQAFEGKIPSILVRAEPPSQLSLEDVFDALQELDDVEGPGKNLHPITRARIVHERLTKEN